MPHVFPTTDAGRRNGGACKRRGTGEKGRQTGTVKSSQPVMTGSKGGWIGEVLRGGMSALSPGGDEAISQGAALPDG